MSYASKSQTRTAPAATETVIAKAPSKAQQTKKPVKRNLEQPAPRVRAASSHHLQQDIDIEELRSTCSELISKLLTDMRYLPPDAPPLVEKRALQILLGLLAADVADPIRDAMIAEFQRRLDSFGEAHEFLAAIARNMTAPGSLVDRVRRFLGRLDDAIDRAQISIFPPEASATLVTRMQRMERFLAEKWLESPDRGILAVHVDEEFQQTIIQVGIASQGPIYITIPRVMRPDEVAQASLRDLVARLEPICGIADPMAVIDGAHQGINYNYYFKSGKVIRAPSGDMDRLAANIATAYEREKLTPANTVIINSAPRDPEQHRAVFPSQRGRGASAWADEARQWDAAATTEGFSLAAEATRESCLSALASHQNVIVIFAHCDGQRILLPDPRPLGTEITADDLRDRRDEIGANKPFVYLFACEAARLTDVSNFASTLLDCGAAGVVAAQTALGAAEGRDLLKEILRPDRGEPPVIDVWHAMQSTDYFEMEVFLA